MVASVVPVGGQTSSGTQTRERALAQIDQARAYGAAGIRINVDIRWLCPTTTCNTDPVAPLVQRADAAGMTVYLHANSTPSWMDGRGRWYGPTGTNADRWAQLFAQFPARFGSTVDGYEVWNEPNIEEFWQQGPDAGEYADLLKAWTRTKAASPSAQIIGGMLSNNDLGYMHQLSSALRGRGGNASNSYFYDMLGVHPYTGAAGKGYDPSLAAGSYTVQTPTGEKDMTFRGVERLRAQVAAEEGLLRDVVLGEFGYDTTVGNWYHATDSQRATYLVSALAISGEWDWMRGMTLYGWNSSRGGFSLVGTASERAVLDLPS
jgi:hypothetical protein